MKEELVSIITPMYKGAAFIGETIRSVQAQTYSDWEMIIVYDNHLPIRIGLGDDYRRRLFA